MNELKTITVTTAANRRDFMLRSLATGLGLHRVATDSASEKRSPDGRTFFEDAGIPSYPFSPERVVVMRNSCADRWRPSNWREEVALRADLTLRCRLSVGKVKVILRLMRALTDYYRVPHLFDNWATGLAVREGLGSTCMGDGFAMFHQFQYMRKAILCDGRRAVPSMPLELATPPVDWWLVLYPDAIDWESYDGQPVYGMIGHIFPSDYPDFPDFPGTTMRTYCLTETVARAIRIFPINNWARIARLDNARAARAVNQFIHARYYSEFESLVRSRPAWKRITAIS